MLFRLAVLVVFGGALAGCGHAELKAPCDASDGTLTSGALSYAEPEPTADRCGSMRPVNVPAPFDTLKHDTKGGGKGAP